MVEQSRQARPQEFVVVQVGLVSCLIIWHWLALCDSSRRIRDLGGNLEGLQAVDATRLWRRICTPVFKSLGQAGLRMLDEGEDVDGS